MSAARRRRTLDGMSTRHAPAPGSSAVASQGPPPDRLLTGPFVRLAAADLAWFVAAGVTIHVLPLHVTGQSEEGYTLLSGQANLPLFGAFCCEAEVSECDFIATYSSSNDHGHFVMRRQ